MIPDINIKDYYLQFIYKAKIDVIDYRNALKKFVEDKEKVYQYITENKNIINDKFGIDLNNYKEYTDKKYNSNETLYKLVIKLLGTIDEHPNKTCIIQLVNYCNILRNENKYSNLLNTASKRKDVPFKEYKKHVFNYYNNVHKCVLAGLGYKFNYGIGTYYVSRWKVQNSANIKPTLDYAATNARKKELLKQGVKLWDDKEAEWYKMRHIPYNAVDYRVFRENGYYYDFAFINSKAFNDKLIEYQRTEYVVNKLRGMGYVQMAEQLCKNEEDIYNLQVDIKYKLNILLYKYPEKYINFIRNAKEDKHKYRAFNRQNR